MKRERVNKGRRQGKANTVVVAVVVVVVVVVVVESVNSWEIVQDKTARRTGNNNKKKEKEKLKVSLPVYTFRHSGHRTFRNTINKIIEQMNEKKNRFKPTIT